MIKKTRKYKKVKVKFNELSTGDIFYHKEPVDKTIQKLVKCVVPYENERGMLPDDNAIIITGDDKGSWAWFDDNCEVKVAKRLDDDAIDEDDDEVESTEILT